MSLTATKLGVRFASPGFNLVEFSLAFDSAYPTSGGEAWDLSTCFADEAVLCIVTKPCEWTASGADLVFVPGTAASAVTVQLHDKGAANADLSSTALAGHAATARVLVGGY